MLKVNLNQTSGFRTSELPKLVKALEHLELTVSSPEFADHIKNFRFNNIENFAYTEMSNVRVLNRVMTGAELLHPDEDREIDIWLKCFNPTLSQLHVVGFTYPNMDTQFINRSFFNRMSITEIAGNIFHEWAHKISFNHPFKYTEDRCYSVPYALGYFIAYGDSKIGAIPKRNFQDKLQDSEIFCSHVGLMPEEYGK